MWRRRHERDLEAEHRPEKIRERISKGRHESSLADAVLGGVDGIITTFAVVAGSTGGQLSSEVVIVLGASNLIADGFSVAVSNYLATRSEQEEVEHVRDDERWQVRVYPEGERREVREIFAQKGFEGETLDRIVEVITHDPDVWVDTMMRDELGVCQPPETPRRAAFATFLAFAVLGFIPLAPYIVSLGSARFATSMGLSAAGFVLIGAWKGIASHGSPLRSGVQTLLVGSAAAALAYGVGALLHHLFGLAPGQGG